MTELTSIQSRLMDAYVRQGYVRYKADVPQSRGEIIMRRDLNHGDGVLQIIHQDGHTITRAIRRGIEERKQDDERNAIKTY